MFSASARNKISIHDCCPGDMVFFDVFGVPHVSIYAPKPGCQGDLIQMSYGATRSGAIKSTLSQQLKTQKDVVVYRSKLLDGAAIADQAERWLRQGIVFDEVRLVNSIYDYETPKTSVEHNVLEYLKYAARRNTLPIKVHQYPYNYTSWVTSLGLGMLFPDHQYSRATTYLFSHLAKYGTDSPDRPKGMSCVIFALLCIAAVALKDEIAPVTAETGWASLKYSSLPADDDSEFSATLHAVKGVLDNKGIEGPGLQDVMTDEQREQFNLERLIHKLGKSLAALNPHEPRPEDLIQALANDADHWESIGFVDNTILKKFDKVAFSEESDAIQKEIEVNREAFYQTFGADIFNRDPDIEERKFTVYRAQ